MVETITTVELVAQAKLGLRLWFDGGAKAHRRVFHAPVEDAPQIDDAAGPPMVEEAPWVIEQAQVRWRGVAVPAQDGPHVNDAASPEMGAIEEVQVGLREVAAIALQENLAELWLDGGAGDHAFSDHVPAQKGRLSMMLQALSWMPPKRCR